jgi:RNA polymerase sigma factor (sigma-70 family)
MAAPSMSSRSLFEESLDAIERAIARVCREARLDRADAEDFASSARLALLADDCAILRKFEGRSSLPSYLTIVVRRLFVDERRASGRWYASAEAQRRGPAAVRLEQLILRDRRSFAEAVEIVTREHPDVTARELDEIAAALPERAPRAVAVPVIEGDDERFAGSSTAADLVEALDVARRSEQANDAVRIAMTTMTAEDRTILRLRFSGNASIANIARALNLEQRPLYRRIEALLGKLRVALEAAGVDAAAADDLIGTADPKLDFDLERKNQSMHPSPQKEDP